MDRGSWRGERLPWGWRGGEAIPSSAAAATRLERALRRLAELASSTTGVRRIGEPEGGPLGAITSCLLNPPATADAVAETELRLGAPLPADYAQFLLYCDGADLMDASGLAAHLLGTLSLVRHAEEMELAYRAGCIPELVIFAAVGDDGDRLAFHTGRMNPSRGCGVLDARRDHRPDQWWVISRDFTSWLEALLGDSPSSSSFGRVWEYHGLSHQPELPLEEEPL